MPETIIPQKSHWLRNITAIIIIVMLVWQFGIPFIDETIKKPSDYLESFFYPDSSNVKYYIEVKDLVDGQITKCYNLTTLKMKQYHAYSISLHTIPDLPAKLTGSYSWDIIIELYQSNGVGFLNLTPMVYKIPCYTCLFNHHWSINDNDVFINYERYYVFTFNLYNDDGAKLNRIDGYNQHILLYLLNYDYP